MAEQTRIHSLQDRIAYLEENRRYIQNALETVLSIGDFQTAGENGSQDDADLLAQAARKINSIISFSSCTFYLVDEESFLFVPAYCNQPERLSDIEEEVDFMIDQGLFAWAVREKRGVFVTSRNHRRQYLLHVISGNNRIRGMFVGQLPVEKSTIADTSLTLLSIIIMRVANAVQNLEFYNLLQNQKDLLEKQVAIRTKELTRSQSQLKQAMDQATELAKKAKKASEAKSDFLAKMSHELRTPLNGIIGMAEIALSTKLDDRQQQVVQIIDRESNILLRIINDILDFSKVEAGKMEIETLPFDLRTIVDEVADTLATQAFQKDLELVTYLSPEMPTCVIGDAMRVKQVLLNLAGNAIKFTDQGEISITGDLESQTDSRVRVKMQVKDTGIGIPEAKQASIFEVFTQADESTTRKYGGTGLGITISKQLVELMGGQLTLDSIENQGSTFSFELEFDKQDTAPQPPTAEHDLGHGTTLIVDPCAASRSVMATYLSAMGCGILEACDANQAFSILGNDSPDNGSLNAIFTSLHMPDMEMSDYGLHIKNLLTDRRLPMVAVTSLEQLTDDTPLSAWGFTHCLAKPVKLADLQQLVQSLCHTNPPRTGNQLKLDGRDAVTAQDKTVKKDGRILLVEDYMTNQQVASMHLSAVGYRVDIADNGQKAVAAYQEQSYDLILMDIQMPIMDGFAATRNIRELERQRGSHKDNGQQGSNRIPIIAMTAHALKDDEEKCLASGMDGYLTKPIRRAPLLNTVAKWIPQGHEIVESARAGVDSSDQPSAKSDHLPMDLATAVDEFGDEQVVLEVADQLIVNARRQIEAMRVALQGKDSQSLQNEAHAIKGGAWTIEARPLGDLAEKIEHLSRDNALRHIAPLMDRFGFELERLEKFIARQK